MNMLFDEGMELDNNHLLLYAFYSSGLTGKNRATLRFITQMDEANYDQGLFFSGIDKVERSGDGENLLGLLVLVPVSFPPGDVIPQPVVNGLPVGLYYYEDISEVKCILESLFQFRQPPSSEVVLLAMWKEFYLNLANNIATVIRKQDACKKSTVRTWFADEVSRDNLVVRLSKPGFTKLVIYFGHGRSRGWSGYRGLRWEHLENREQKVPNVGCVIAMACDNLKFEKNRLPFGIKWVMNKKSCSFFGAVSSVKIIPMKRICSMVGELLTVGDVRSVGELMTRMDKQILDSKNEELIDCWSKFRLIGTPLAIL